ncbi:MAG: STAS domain-containing protein [Acidimicrobiia bacterium]
MPGTPFSATVRQEDGGTVIDLVGDIDRNASDQLISAYQQAVAERATGAVVLSFRDVDYINSTGIAVIVTLLAKARAEGRSLRAWGLSPHYQEIFQITRLADFMTIYETEPQALSVS